MKESKSLRRGIVCDEQFDLDRQTVESFGDEWVRYDHRSCEYLAKVSMV